MILATTKTIEWGGRWCRCSWQSIGLWSEEGIEFHDLDTLYVHKMSKGLRPLSPWSDEQPQLLLFLFKVMLNFDCM